ncbi:diguanylate cyclase [Rhodospirillum rubrum]|nr:diguanylate cyclase [Rhodospirillum rubrum]MBK1678182.1 diguanylate cyclase [Rhodospirillum rubrum]
MAKVMTRDEHDDDPSRFDAQAATIASATILLHPGPAAIVALGGGEALCNAQGEPLRPLFSPEAADSLMPVIRSALETGVPQQKVVDVGRDGLPAQFDLTILPTAEPGRVVVIGRDVTLERTLRKALTDSRQRYKDFVDLSIDFTWETGPDGRFVFISPDGALGYAARDLVGALPWTLMDITDAQSGATVFNSPVRVKDVDIWVRRRDGTLACLKTSSMPVFDADGEWSGGRGVCHDITEQRDRDKALARALNRQRVVANVERTFRDEIDPSNMLNVAAEALARSVGGEGCLIYRAALDDGPDRPFLPRGRFGEGGDEKVVLTLEALGEGAHAQTTPDGKWTVLIAASRYRRQINGAVVLWRRIERGAWSEDDHLLIVDVANQIGSANEQIGQHDRIISMSRTDGLTGLLNRRAFFDDMDRRLKGPPGLVERRAGEDGARRSERPARSALLYIDLDNFKWVNDAHGHLRGDEALMTVRKILTDHTRATDIVARLGGDEFAIWLEGADAEAASAKAAEILAEDALLRPFDGSPDRPLSLSIGLAIHDPASGEGVEDLTARADMAMYAAKHGGKGRFSLSPPPPHTPT